MDAALTRDDEEDRRSPARDEAVSPLVLARVPQVSRHGVAIVRAGRIEWVNPALESMLGSDGRLRGAMLSEIGAERVGGGPDEGIDLGALCVDGSGAVTCNLTRASARTASVAVEATRLDAGSSGRWVMTFRGVSHQVRTHDDLRESEARFRALAANAPIGVFHSDHGLRLNYVNPRFAELWGRAPEDLHGNGWLQQVHEDDLAEVVTTVGRVLEGEEVALRFRLRRDGGEVRLLHTNVVPVTRSDRSVGFVGSIEDVTEAHEHEARLAWQATHDALTGLVNRTGLWNRVEEVLADPVARPALLFFDLDDFKVVNDSLGHDAGDVLLRIVATRLAAAVRPGDSVARFGGDEFVVLCRDVPDDASAREIAERLLAVLEDPLDLGARRVRVTASVGVVLAGGRTADGLIRDADVAMYQAKAAGKDRVELFDEQARVRMQQHLDIVEDLRLTLVGGEVPLAYQPLVGVADGRILGAEALLRYVHPTEGPVPPLELVRLAEASGCIVDLGSAVLETACRQLVAWRDERGDDAPGYVAVNVAAAQLVVGDPVAHVRDVLDRHGLAPGDLCLELTETQLLSDVEAVDDVIRRLRAAGVRIAIDDFGTGYSSLSYLRRFPVDIVKLDRSFIAEVEREPATMAIVTAVLRLADILGLDVVAEGVETTAQLELLDALGCAAAQGWALGRPVPPDDFPSGRQEPR
jgi:diguanylate cyclase (GGDEF)-like protein/PAS domain S-box-containing protein